MHWMLLTLPSAWTLLLKVAKSVGGFALDDDELAQHEGGGVCGVFGGRFDGTGGVVALLVGKKAVLFAHGLAQGGVVPFGFRAAVGGGGDAAQQGIVGTEHGGEQRRRKDGLAGAFGHGGISVFWF